MPNIKSAKKALRQSIKKKQHNLFWKGRINQSKKNIRKFMESKSVDIDILKKEEIVLQKVLDKAAKNNVIHKNKASRLKSRYAKKITAFIKDAANSKASADTNGGKPAKKPAKTLKTKVSKATKGKKETKKSSKSKSKSSK